MPHAFDATLMPVWDFRRRRMIANPDQQIHHKRSHGTVSLDSPAAADRSVRSVVD